MANPFRAAFTYGIPTHRGIELPQCGGGSSLSISHTGSLLLRAKGSLRLFRTLLKNQFLWSSFLFERKVAGKQHRRDFNPLAD
jgi:hypothetical protein